MSLECLQLLSWSNKPSALDNLLSASAMSFNLPVSLAIWYPFALTSLLSAQLYILLAHLLWSELQFGSSNLTSSPSDQWTTNDRIEMFAVPWMLFTGNSTSQLVPDQRRRCAKNRGCLEFGGVTWYSDYLKAPELPLPKVSAFSPITARFSHSLFISHETRLSYFISGSIPVVKPCPHPLNLQLNSIVSKILWLVSSCLW